MDRRARTRNSVMGCAALLSGLKYDLTGWTAGLQSGSVSHGDGTETVTFGDWLAVAANPARFLQL